MDELSIQRRDLTANRDALAGQIQAGQAEIARLSGRAGALESEIAQAERQVGIANRERQLVTTQISILQAQADGVDATARERDELANAVAELTITRDAIVQDVNVLQSDLRQGRQELAQISGDIASAQDDHAAAEAQLDVVTTALSEARTALGTAREEILVVLGQRDAARADYFRLSASIGSEWSGSVLDITADDAASVSERTPDPARVNTPTQE